MLFFNLGGKAICEKKQCNLYYYNSFSCFFAKNFLHGHELSHEILCLRAAMTTAEQTEPSRFRGAKS